MEVIMVLLANSIVWMFILYCIPSLIDREQPGQS